MIRRMLRSAYDKIRGIGFPYLDFCFDIGWLKITTELWYFRMESFQTQYIVIAWNVFRWNGHFRWYAPGMRPSMYKQFLKERTELLADIALLSKDGWDLRRENYELRMRPSVIRMGDLK